MSKVNGGAFYLLLFYASLVPSIKHSRAINSGHTVGCSSAHSESQMFPSKDQVKGRAGYTAQDWRYGRGKVSYKIQCSWSHNSGTTSQRKKWFVGLALKGEWGLTPGWICWAFFFNYVKLSCILLRTTSDMLLKKYVFFLYYNITSERMPYLNWRYFLFKRRDEGSVIFRYVRRDMLYREPLPFGRTLDSAICLIIHQECTNCGHRCKSTLAKTNMKPIYFMPKW